MNTKEDKTFQLAQTPYGRSCLAKTVGLHFEDKIRSNRYRLRLPQAPSDPRIRHGELTYLRTGYGQTMTIPASRISDPREWRNFFEYGFPAMLRVLLRDDEVLLKALDLQPWGFTLTTADLGEGYSRCTAFHGSLFYAYTKSHPPQDLSSMDIVW
jgi:hypothetical protein